VRAKPDSVVQTRETVEKIEREKIRLAFGTWLTYVDGTPLAVIITLLMCGLFPSVGNTTPSHGVPFVCAVIVWAAVSTMTFQHYERVESSRPVVFWRRTLTAIWGSHALIWGAMLFVFWDEGNTVNQAILCTIVLGVMVSYFFLLTMSLPVLLSTLGAMIGVATAAFLSHGDTLSQVFLFMYPLFSLILVNYGLKAARSYHAALQLRFENEALADALSRASQAKSTFLASMSHELRTPLNAIIGYSDLMLQRTFGPIAPTRYASYVQDIHDSGSHLLHMINDLLDLAKIEAGKQPMRFGPVRLRDIVDEALRLVEPQAGRGHVSMSVSLTADVVVDGDERAIKQILVNLLSNAIKFTNPGGLAVVFCQRTPHGRLAFGVKDTGVGMSAEMQSRAMQPFEQGGDVYTVEGRGTGLGLSICKSLAEAHHGLLKLESTPGVGSKVWVEFPAERILSDAAAA
jgi:signal transduction histidine kinase